MGKYIVGVIGGACAGSEIATTLADLGMDVVVFEQNQLPYGKIEDGLPRWHKKLQARERKNIDGKLDRPEISFVPNCRIGEDLSVADLDQKWNFNMIVMANGAWRDRALRVPDTDKVEDDSLVYQNKLVYWFNHYHEKSFTGHRYTIPKNPIIVGGGLASIDMGKLCQFEMFNAVLVERGMDPVDPETLEHKGVHKVAESLGLNYEEMGIKPARLFYRKRIIDMPLVPLGDHPEPAKLEKAKAIRTKIINNATKKYGFTVTEFHSPAALRIENGSVTGLTFDVYHWDDGFKKTGEQATVDTDMVISSIGSIPQPIEGVPMDGELYQWDETFTGAVTGLRNFYCVGNAITGRGNIKDSSANARRLGAVVTAGIDGGDLDYEKWFRAQEEEAKVHVDKMIAFLRSMPEADDARRKNIQDLVAAHWKEIGYQGYADWRDGIIAKR